MRREVVVGVRLGVRFGVLAGLSALAACGAPQGPDGGGLSGPTEPSSPETASGEPSSPRPGEGGPPPGPSTPANGSPSQTASQPPAHSSGAGAEADAILTAHNRVRATHCARPLAWSPALAATAQEWANSLRDANCSFEHSQTAYGENLAAGTRLSGENAVELWYAEAAKYNYKKPGFSPATGHFTQVVWAGSKNVGCGFSECQGMRLWVCHYDPPGNVLSLFPDNVSPANCK